MRKYLAFLFVLVLTVSMIAVPTVVEAAPVAPSTFYGVYRIQHVASGMYLTANGDWDLFLYPLCDASYADAAQVWKIEPNSIYGDSMIRAWNSKNSSYGKAIARDSRNTSNVYLGGYPRDFGVYRWSYYTDIIASLGLYAGNTSGSNVKVNSSYGGTDEWRLIQVGEYRGTYRIKNVYSQKYITYNSNTSFTLDYYGPGSGKNQTWDIYDFPDGTSKIIVSDKTHAKYGSALCHGSSYLTLESSTYKPLWYISYDSSISAYTIKDAYTTGYQVMYGAQEVLYGSYNTGYGNINQWQLESV